MEQQGFMQGNHKWYLIGAVAAIGIIFFIRKKGSSASAGAGTALPTQTGQPSQDSQSSLNTIEGQLGQAIAGQQQLGQQMTDAQAGWQAKYDQQQSQITSQGKQITDLLASPPPASSPQAASGVQASGNPLSTWGSLTNLGAGVNGFGGWRFIANNFYGTSLSQGVGNIGANEVAAAVNAKGGHVTASDISKWNSGLSSKDGLPFGFFRAGDAVYAGNANSPTAGS